MPEVISLGLALIVGFQSGVFIAWRFFRVQRLRLLQQHERERELLENEIKHERRERRRSEEQLRVRRQVRDYH